MSRNPYFSIGREVLECPAHKAQAYEMACKSMVLLKNEKHILPLNPKNLKRIALIGPNADDPQTLLANYYGVPSEIITPLKGLERRLKGKVMIDYMKGVDHVRRLDGGPSFQEIAGRAGQSDVIVFVSGINANYEGEAGDAGAGGFAGFASGDRTTLQLPQVQVELLKELKKTGRPLIIVNMSGSVMSFERESQHADAIVQAWYGGQSAGDAIADVLLGVYNPSGRMPLTTYMKDEDLPAMEDYSMSDRTYRYFRGEVRYPFGYGLSYTSFDYETCPADTAVETGKPITYSVKVTNTGDRDGDEVVQLYVSHSKKGTTERMPLCALKGFKRIFLKKGESKVVSFVLSPEDLALVNSSGMLREKAGKADIYIGGGQPRQSQGVSYPLCIKGDVFQIY